MITRTPPHASSLYVRIAAGGCLGLMCAASLVDGYLPVFSELVGAIRMISFVVHEAGHPTFGLAGTFLGWLGGTIAQLLPGLWICVSSLFRRRDYALSLGLVWLGINLLDISRYMADANEMKLALFHPGMFFGESNENAHDWHNIFGALGLLGFADGFAFVTLSSGIVSFALSMLNAVFPLRSIVPILWRYVTATAESGQGDKP